MKPTMPCTDGHILFIIISFLGFVWESRTWYSFLHHVQFLLLLLVKGGTYDTQNLWTIVSVIFMGIFTLNIFFSLPLRANVKLYKSWSPPSPPLSLMQHMERSLDSHFPSCLKSKMEKHHLLRFRGRTSFLLGPQCFFDPMWICSK
jgi:hypothetical protein